MIKETVMRRIGSNSKSHGLSRVALATALAWVGTGMANAQEAPSPNPQPSAVVAINSAKLAESSTESLDATILLVTASELAEAWSPFANWKTASGKRTKIVTVSQIKKQYDATSVQEKIRLCVRDHIDNHKTRWVILGGDCLPGGKGLVPGGHTTVHRQERKGIPTDIVYLSKTNWDADGDGKYGEFKDDRAAIQYPDGTIGLGRIPVRTVQDVAAFTDKVIAFESKYPTSDFATKMVYTCTDTPAYPKVTNSWDGYVSKVWDGNVDRFYAKSSPWDKQQKSGRYPLIANNLVSLINKKSTGKFHLHGHGNLDCWLLGRTKFNKGHVRKLDNEGAYPLITTVSCNTGEYDSRRDPSIVESMLRRPKAGTVAIVAPVRTGKPHFANPSDFRLMVSEGKLDGTTLTMTRYWANGLGKTMTTGQALMLAKSQMVSDATQSPNFHLCMCELNLLGDPTLDMRAKKVRLPKVSFPTTVKSGTSTVEIKTDAPGSTVCLWKGKEVYSVALADSKGNVNVDINPATAGDISVTVSGPSLNTLSGKIVVSEK